jgi:hypothetical protein
MTVDLPLSSAFTPDLSVARVRINRDTLTLLPVEPGTNRALPEIVSGTVLESLPPGDQSVCFRAAIALSQGLPLTITF